MVFKIDVWNSFAIFTRNTCGAVIFEYSCKLEACNCIKKRLQHRRFLENIAKFLRTTYFEEHLGKAASVLLIIKLVIQFGYLPTSSYIKTNVEWFLLRRFVGLLRIYFLLIIGRTHSNTLEYYSKGYLFWYQNFDRFTQVVVHYLMSILMMCK